MRAAQRDRVLVVDDAEQALRWCDWLQPEGGRFRRQPASANGSDGSGFGTGPLGPTGRFGSSCCQAWTELRWWLTNRKTFQRPLSIIMLTARDEEVDKDRWFVRWGRRDYLVKPFFPANWLLGLERGFAPTGALSRPRYKLPGRRGSGASARFADRWTHWHEKHRSTIVNWNRPGT